MTVHPTMPADLTVVAERAAARAGVEVHLASGPTEIREISALLARVWGTDLQASPGPRNVLSAITDTGGYVAGAWAGHTLVGASYGITYVDVDGPCLRSQVTGTVHPGRGIGEAIKRHQHAWAAAAGLRRITWTFDPLVRRNARFNLDRLGASIVRFVPDFYGSLDDGVNGDDETDRCVVRWDLAATPDGAPPPTSTDLVAEGHEVLLGVEAGAPVLHTPLGDHLLVATPVDIVALRRDDPATAVAWRRAVRTAFSTAFAAGLVADLITVDGSYRFRRRSEA